MTRTTHRTGERAALSPAAQRFVTTANELRAVLARLRLDAERGATARVERVGRKHDVALDELRRRADQAQRSAPERALVAARAVGGPAAFENGDRSVVTEPLAVASHVRVGVAGGGVPVLVPLVGEANLHVVGDAGRPDVYGLLRGVLSRALAGTGPGQLALTIVDPELRGIHAAFSGLRSADESLIVPPITDEYGVDALVSRLVETHQRIAGIVRGSAGTLARLREQTRQPVERYELVVFLDYPTAVSERSAVSLASLMRDGPAYGISVVLQSAQPPTEEPWTRAVRATADTLMVAPRPTWSRVPGLSFTFDAMPTDDAVARLAGRVAEAARSAAAPLLPLADILSAAESGGGSADGLVVPVGRSGQQIVQVSLGDPVTQRNNILVTGAVGQGKSNLLQVMVHALAARYGPDEVELYLLDMREGVTFFPLAGDAGANYLPHARVVSIHTDREFALSVLDHLVAQFEPRAEALRRYDGTYATFRRRDPQSMPRTVLVIDEFQMLFERHDDLAERAAETLEKLVRMGRGFGVHVVLASQALSHMPALGPKADVVFAQFPTRLALRNSRAESVVALDTDNDEASLLRFRGEAIVNHGYGRRSDNQRFVVAVADEPTITGIRTGAFRRWRGVAGPPSVFDGSRLPTLATVVSDLRDLRRGADAGRGRVALVGRAVGVRQEAVGAVLAREPGRHLAVLGTGTASAVGALHAAALSLAVQHADGMADFTLLDLLGPDDGGGVAQLVDLLTRFGFPPEIHAGSEITPALDALAERMHESRPTAPHYVFGLGLDRATDLDDPQALREILAHGSNRGVHLLAWWSSPAVFENHRGYNDASKPATVLALRMEQRSAKDLMGPTSVWAGANNRGAVWAPRERAEPRLVVPFAPLDRTSANELLRMDWDAA